MMKFETMYYIYSCDNCQIKQSVVYIKLSCKVMIPLSNPAKRNWLTSLHSRYTGDPVPPLPYQRMTNAALLLLHMFRAGGLATCPGTVQWELGHL